MLKGSRLSRRGLELETGAGVRGRGGVVVCLDARLGWLIRRVERDRSLLPYALYRVALAAAITMRRES